MRMEDKISKNDKNLESEEHKISKNRSNELESDFLFIPPNSDSNLESEIEKCCEILQLEEKVLNNSNLDDISIEKNKFGNEVEKISEFIKCVSSCIVENFKTHLNSGIKQNKASAVFIQSDNYTQLHSDSFKQFQFKTHVAEIYDRNQMKNNLEHTQSPERKRIKTTKNFNNELELVIETSEKLSCIGNIPDDKFVFINSSSINMSQNKSLNAKTQNDVDFANSVINYENVSVNSNNNNNASIDFTMQESEKKINKSHMINSDLKLKSIFQHIERTNSINSNEENKLRRDSCETTCSGDTLILHYEESDIDSEIEKCNETFDQNSLEKLMCSKTNSHQIFENYSHSASYDSSEKLELKDYNVKSGETCLNNSSRNIFFKANNQCETNNFLDSIEFEIEKCNELLNPSEAKSQITEISETCNNSFHIKNNEREMENIKNIPHIIKYEENVELENNVVTLNEKEIKKNLEIESISKNEILEEKIQENSELQNVVTSYDKSPKETCIDKKKLLSKVTPQKHHPERIFKLAIKSVNEIGNENIKLITKSTNSSPDQDNNSLSLTKLSDNKISKQITKDSTTVKDYFEDEKDDITNPEWQAVKNLSTNEERYQQVRKCWKSRTVPDPNKNLTYHSYRKRLFRSDSHEECSIKQHKRHASSSLPGRDAKRPCTFFLDKEIDSIKKSKEIQKQEIINEMQNKINSVDGECFSRGKSLHDWSCYSTHERDFYNYSQHPLDRFNKVTNITNKFHRIVDNCESSFRNKIYALNERRNEVLKFYSFYKGLNNSNDDPTFLTESQFNELDEIENIYKQFDHYYKDLNS